MTAVVEKLRPAAELCSSMFLHCTEKFHTLLSEPYCWRLKAICSSCVPAMIPQLDVWLFPACHVSMYWYFIPFQFDECIFLSFLCTPGFACSFFLSKCLFFTWHFIPFILPSSAVSFQMNPSDADSKKNILN